MYLISVPGAVHAADAVPADVVAEAVPVNDTGSVFEANAWGGYLWRGGDALNSSGGVPNEIEDFPLAGGGVVFATPAFNHWLIQLELAGEGAFSNNDVGGVPADDTYDGGYTGGGHLTYTHNNFLIGAFGGVGQTYFNDTTADHDVTQWLVGGEGRYLAEWGSLALQVGYLDTDADSGNMETLSDTTFVRVVGQRFFNGGLTMLEGSVAYADGTQDADDAPFSNPTDLWAWDVTLEHQLSMLSGSDTAASVFVSYQGVQVNEDSTSGSTDSLVDQGIYAGLKFRFGANESLYEREMRTAPGLPNVHRWLGAVPAVD
ncbi:MAG: porin [Hyphomicrobiales bacterium]|nr:porin [Hyphomicrobiales bacterium]MCP4998118.1 porin [Hyphomicrobiales bacterium]